MTRRKKAIRKELPSGFVIDGVLGPEKVTPLGHSAHVKASVSLMDKEVYIVFGHIDKEKQEKTICSKCHLSNITVFCEKYCEYFCKDCCSECPDFRKCPRWGDESE